MSYSSRLLQLRQLEAFHSVTGRLRYQPVAQAVLWRRNASGVTARSAPPNPSGNFMRRPAAEQLSHSISTHDLKGVHESYRVVSYGLAAKRKTGSSIRKPISHEQLYVMLDMLSISGRPHDLNLLERILCDMKDFFGHDPTDKVHCTIVHGLIQRGQTMTVYNWLMSTPLKTDQYTNPIHWIIFLEHCKKTGEVGLMRQALKTMSQSGCKPTNEMFRIILQAFFASKFSLRDFHSLIDEAAREGLKYDGTIAMLIYQSFVSLGRVSRAEGAQLVYKKTIPYGGEGSRIERHAEIEQEALTGGVKAAVAMAQSLQVHGFEPNSRTLTLAIRYCKSVVEMKFAASTLGIQLNVVHWSVVVTNFVRSGDLPKALATYANALAEGIVPDVAIIYPIINALCFPPLTRPSEADIDHALELYQDFLNGLTGAKSKKFGPNGQLYSTLLRTLASSGNVQKYLPRAMSLLDEMEANRVVLDTSADVASVTMLLVKVCSSYEEALHVFKRVAHSKRGPGLDSKGYAAVLHTFCKLFFTHIGVLSSIDYYFDMVKEMTASGYCPTPHVYNIILQLLGAGAKSMRPPDIIPCVRAVHSRLSLDASLSPDIAVWNQLMDTYQRAGSFLDAQNIWEMLVLSQQYDETSVSVMMDACAYAREWQWATRYCTKLFQTGFAFSQKHWNGWLEGMCNVGKIDEAVRLACLEMDKKGGDVRPDEETIRILLKYARGSIQEADVRAKIKYHLPHLWQLLPRSLG